MKKTILSSVLLLLSFLIILVFCAGMSTPLTAQAKAPEAINKRDITRVDFVHYAKPGLANSKQDLGYKLMGVKWNTSVPVAYSINTSSIPTGLNSTNLTTEFAEASETWDNSTSRDLFNDSVTGTAAHYGVLDGKNTVEFGAYSGNNNVIAVTSVWFNKRTKSIVEFDMLCNTYYAWGDADTTTAKIMDIQNIATHELGHAVGLSDIYSSSYSNVTMYGYSGYNETNKRSLETPDITGLQILYGT